MSTFDRQEIPEALLDGRCQDNDDASSDFEDGINTLLSFSLVATDIGRSQFEMHQLAQFSTKEWLELNQELATLMGDSYPVGQPENWMVCQALLLHAQGAVGSRPTDAKTLEAWASVLFKAAWHASEMGQYNEAQKMSTSSLNSLGSVLNWQGKYKEAEAIHRPTLEASKRVLGAEHPDTLTTMANLASTYPLAR